MHFITFTTVCERQCLEKFYYGGALEDDIKGNHGAYWSQKAWKVLASLVLAHGMTEEKSSSPSWP